MTDLLYLGIAVISLVVTVGLLKLCDHLSADKSGE